MHARFTVVLLSLAIAACTGVDAPAIPAHGVTIAAQVPGPCVNGGCDPANQTMVLGLITVLNTSDAVAYVRACGSRPAISEQQFVGGVWQYQVARECVAGPLSIALAPHNSIQVNSFFDPGTRRLIVGVAADTLLTTEVPSTSASFVVR